MPFHPDDAGDTAYVRSERRRAADRVIGRPRFALGVEVNISTPPTRPELALTEPRGIVVGVIPEGGAHDYRVMCSLRTGMEMPIQFADAALAPVAD